MKLSKKLLEQLTPLMEDGWYIGEGENGVGLYDAIDREVTIEINSPDYVGILIKISFASNVAGEFPRNRGYCIVDSDYFLKTGLSLP